MSRKYAEIWIYNHTCGMYNIYSVCTTVAVLDSSNQTKQTDFFQAGIRFNQFSVQNQPNNIQIFFSFVKVKNVELLKKKLAYFQRRLLCGKPTLSLPLNNVINQTNSGLCSFKYASADNSKTGKD